MEKKELERKLQDLGKNRRYKAVFEIISNSKRSSRTDLYQFSRNKSSELKKANVSQEAFDALFEELAALGVVRIERRGTNRIATWLFNSKSVATFVLEGVGSLEQLGDLPASEDQHTVTIPMDRDSVATLSFPKDLSKGQAFMLLSVLNGVVAEYCGIDRKDIVPLILPSESPSKGKPRV